MDGAVAVDENGRFVPTPETRIFFDYFLSASGEEPLHALEARIVEAIRARLSPEAAQEAVALMERYLLYRERVRALAEDGEGLDLELRYQGLREIRREILGSATADAFFGEEESRDRISLEGLRIARESTGEERARRLALLEKDRPQDSVAAQKDALAPLRLLQAEQRLRRDGASTEETRREREGAFGAEVADRLEELNRRRSEWRRRLEDFRAARDAISTDASLSREDRSSALAELLAELTPEERRRVLALDRIGEALERQGRSVRR